MMNRVDYVISVDNEHQDRLSEVAEALADVGLEVKQTLPAVGIISGTCDESREEMLRRTEGVAAVEQSRSVRTF